MTYKLKIFTGAGVSVASGIGTFRTDEDALWKKYNPSIVCNIQAFAAHKKETFEFYNTRKVKYADTKPNESHFITSCLQEKYDASIFTSNVDLLHEAAGCVDVKHVHGSFDKMFCIPCEHTWHIGNELFDINAECPECGKQNAKPGVVFFGEQAPMYEQLWEELWDPDTVKVIMGTSLQVISPNMLGAGTDKVGISIYIDPDAARYASMFTHVLPMKSEDCEEALLEILSQYDINKSLI